MIIIIRLIFQYDHYYNGYSSCYSFLIASMFQWNSPSSFLFCYFVHWFCFENMKEKKINICMFASKLQPPKNVFFPKERWNAWTHAHTCTDVHMRTHTQTHTQTTFSIFHRQEWDPLLSCGIIMLLFPWWRDKCRVIIIHLSRQPAVFSLQLLSAVRLCSSAPSSEWGASLPLTY